ncbi:cation diffusion facilitator family transporter [Capnocytophaga catalasegens]|uniref:Cation transporter n=1 Tax=Capnocytophaga catalasegens TaxID=1004260 RepID=A0AAV5B0F9_9FLAO|nr:cation diffusion facilitator family transporter [Capnocytophaga catalasegens]GIZ14007.1 cation transporter [Capnocytophaga catalasegens]GJM51108.1 cation transporter [Capnocytophaga catalasegens]GJM54082.1 cation transporter [Capnocytophaga catalasegens]
MSTHHHTHHHTHIHSNLKEMKTAFGLNLFFTIIEFVGGILTGSFAIITDAFHDLGDSIALGLAIWLEKYANRKPSEQYTYGYRRFSLLSAYILSTILIIGSVIMIYNAVEKLFTPYQVTTWGMILLALFGLLINGIAFWRMHQSGAKNQYNSRAMMLHFLEDVLGWVAVLVGGVVIYFTQWFWIDAILSLGIATFILYNAIPNWLNVTKIFLQKAPEQVNLKELTKQLQATQCVVNIHKLQLWTQDGHSHVATMHALVSQDRLSQTDSIRKQLQEVLHNFHINQAIIQVEAICNEKCE